MVAPAIIGSLIGAGASIGSPLIGGFKEKKEASKSRRRERRELRDSAKNLFLAIADQFDIQAEKERARANVLARKGALEKTLERVKPLPVLAIAAFAGIVLVIVFRRGKNGSAGRRSR